MNDVLIVDDDAALIDMLTDYLGGNGISLTARNDGTAGLEAARSGRYDLMLLDVMLPDLDGFEVLRQLRTESEMGVLLLSARGEAADRVLGLRMGADDYLPKPFMPEELVARIGAILRRSARWPATATLRTPTLEIEGLVLDREARTVQFAGDVVDLTSIEVALLESFLSAPGVVLGREELAVQVFRRPFHPLDRSLDMYVSRLRRKLRVATPFGDRIRTIRSSGYQFATPQSECSAPQQTTERADPPETLWAGCS